MSTVEVNKVNPSSGTDLQLGDSGDTITIPAGATFDSSAATNTLPANVVTTDGTQTLTNKSIVATQLTGTITPSDNTVTTAKIVDANVTLDKLSATGTKDATTFLRGDNTFATVTSPGWVKIGDTVTASGTSNIDFDNLSSTYQYYCIIGSQVRPTTTATNLYMNSGVGGGTYATQKTSIYVEGYNNEADNDKAITTSAVGSLGYDTGNQYIMKNCGNNASYGKAGTIRAYLGGYGQGGSYASFDVYTTFWTDNNYVNAVRVTGMVQGSADSVRFLYSSGTIATGKFTLFGITQ